MTPEYSIVNSCLQLLKQSDWSTIKKLQVEINLIKIKRHLLDENLPVAVKGGSYSEAVFKELLCQMNAIRDAEWGNDQFNPLLHSLNTIIAALTMGETADLRR